MKISTKYVTLALLLLFSLSIFGTKLAAAALSPDINGDGYVNIKDAVILGAAFGTQSGDPNWNPNADLDENGVVNALDAMMLVANFGPVV